MFAYCENNPVNRADPSGHSWFYVLVACAAVVVVCALAVVAAPVLAVAGVVTSVSAVATGAFGLATVAAGVGAVAAGMSIAESIPKSKTASRSKAKEKDITTTKPKSATPIYRYYSSKTENLAPRPGKDYDGLSFSTIPPRPGISAVVTTIEEINATGILMAMPTGGSHVTVIPTNGSVLQWMSQGQSSMWSQTLSAIVIEWDGVN